MADELGTLGNATVTIEADFKPLKADLKKARTATQNAMNEVQATASKSMGGIEKSAQKSMKNVESIVKKSMAEVGRSIASVGKKMTLAVTAPVVGMGVVFSKAAIDAEETENKFDVVFSNVSKKAGEAAKDLDENFGLSANAAKKLLADTGDLMTGFGFTQDAAIDLAHQVNKLAVDLSSFQNYAGGFEGASIAITKALLGETEQAKALGIVIRQDSKEFKSLVENFQESEGMTLLQAKAMAALSISMAQSKNSIGDYARTQDQLANKLRELTSDLADLAVKVGSVLMPVVEKLVDFLRDIINKLKTLKPEVIKVGISIAGLAAIVGPFLIAVGSLTIAISMLKKATVLWGTASVVTNGALTGSVVTASILAAKLLLIAGSLYAIRAAYKQDLGGLRKELDLLARDVKKNKLFSWITEQFKETQKAHDDFISSIMDGVQKKAGPSIAEQIKGLLNPFGVLGKKQEYEISVNTESTDSAKEKLIALKKEMALLKKEGANIGVTPGDIFSGIDIGENFRSVFKQIKEDITSITGGLFETEDLGNQISNMAEEQAKKLAQKLKEAYLQANKEATEEGKEEEGQKAKLELEGYDGSLLRDEIEEMQEWARQQSVAIELRMQAQPSEAMMEELESIRDLAAEFPDILDEETLEILTGEAWQSFGADGQIAIKDVIDQASELGPAFADAFSKIKEAEDKAKTTERMEILSNVIGEIGQIASALPGKFQKFAQVVQTTARLVTASARLMAGDLTAIFTILVELVSMMGLFGDKTEKEAKGMTKIMEDIGDAADAWGDQLTDVITEFVRTGKASFEDLADSIIDDLLSISIRAAILDPLIDFGGSLLGFSKGGVFAGTKVYKAANGIITRPTEMLSAAGPVLTGEGGGAGEAVIPLSTVGGHLGVDASGIQSSSNVLVEVNNYGSTPAEVRETIDPDGTHRVQVVIHDAVKTGLANGQYDDALGSFFGVTRRGFAT